MIIRTPVYLFVVLTPTSALAQPHAQPPPPAESRQAEVEFILRVSKELIDGLSVTMPINRTADGRMTTGSVTSTTRVSVDLKKLDDRSEFTISLSGTARSRFRTDTGRTISRGTSTTRFVSHKQVSYDGKKFHQRPATASARSCTNVNRICAKDGGVVGAVVQQVARGVTDLTMPDINHNVSRSAEQMLRQRFDEVGTDIVNQLNKESKFDKAVVKYFPETEKWVTHVATTKDHIIAGAGPQEASLPELPTASAPIELWLRTRPVEAIILESLIDLHVVHDLLREHLPEDEARQLAEDVTVESIDGWSVIRIGLQIQEIKR